jgi:hypothetical protein
MLVSFSSSKNQSEYRHKKYRNKQENNNDNNDKIPNTIFKETEMEEILGRESFQSIEELKFNEVKINSHRSKQLDQIFGDPKCIPNQDQPLTALRGKSFNTSKSKKVSINISLKKPSTMSRGLEFQETLILEEDIPEIENINKRKNTFHRSDTRELKRKSINEKRERKMMSKFHSFNPVKLKELLNKTEVNSLFSISQAKIRKIDIVIALLCVINIIVSILDNEIYISESNTYINNQIKNENARWSADLLKTMQNRKISDIENVLRAANLIISITGAILIYLRFKIKVKLLQIDNKLSQYDGIISSQIWRQMVPELILVLIYYPPYVNLIFSGSDKTSVYVFNLNSIISLFVLLKIYFVLRLFKFSRWTDDWSNSICNKYKVRSGVQFAIKAELKKRPFVLLFSAFSIIMVVFSFLIRTFEYGIFSLNNQEGIKGGNDLRNLLNSFWLVVNTMTTLGYGEFFPKSNFGRVIGVIGCFIGMIVLSMCVVSLSTVADFTPEEKKAFTKLKKILSIEYMENKAGNVIRDIIIMRKITHRSYLLENHHDLLQQKFVMLTLIKKDVSVFKSDMRVINSYSIPVDEMLRRIELTLKEDLIKLRKNLNKINNFDGEFNLIKSSNDDLHLRLSRLIDMQNDISKYIVNHNNELFMKKLNSDEKKKQQIQQKHENQNGLQIPEFNIEKSKTLGFGIDKYKPLKSNKKLLVINNQGGLKSSRGNKSRRMSKLKSQKSTHPDQNFKENFSVLPRSQLEAGKSHKSVNNTEENNFLSNLLKSQREKADNLITKDEKDSNKALKPDTFNNLLNTPQSVSNSQYIINIVKEN